MPIYDYLCGACGDVVEVVHGIHAEGPRFCPGCGVEGRMRKAVAAPAIVFKGSGWAKKDRSTTAAAGRKAGAAKDDSPAASGDAGSKESSNGGSDGAGREATATTEKAAAKASSAATPSGDD